MLGLQNDGVKSDCNESTIDHVEFRIARLDKPPSK
jgi:hypothetical protein